MPPLASTSPPSILICLELAQALDLSRQSIHALGATSHAVREICYGPRRGRLRRADAEREGRRRKRTVDGDGVAAARQAGEFADVLTLVSVIAMVAVQAPDRIVLGD